MEPMNVALICGALIVCVWLLSGPKPGQTYTVQCPEFAIALEKALKEVPRGQ